MRDTKVINAPATEKRGPFWEITGNESTSGAARALRLLRGGTRRAISALDSRNRGMQESRCIASESYLAWAGANHDHGDVTAKPTERPD